MSWSFPGRSYAAKSTEILASRSPMYAQDSSVPNEWAFHTVYNMMRKTSKRGDFICGPTNTEAENFGRDKGISGLGVHSAAIDRQPNMSSISRLQINGTHLRMTVTHSRKRGRYCTLASSALHARPQSPTSPAQPRTRHTDRERYTYTHIFERRVQQESKESFHTSIYILYPCPPSKVNQSC